MMERRNDGRDYRLVFILLTIVACAAFIALARSFRSEDSTRCMVEIATLKDRLAEYEEELEVLRERSGAAGNSIKDVFSAIALEAQMKKLRAEIEDIKIRGGEQNAVAAMQDRQERVLKEANRAHFRTWRGALDANLARAGFDEEQRQRIGADYGKLLESLEEVQLRWFRGDLDWDRTMDEVKMRSIEFYDAVERNYDAETARRTIDIAFPGPEMKRYFFGGSGQ